VVEIQRERVAAGKRDNIRQPIWTIASSPARARPTIWSHSFGMSSLASWVTRVSLISMDKIIPPDSGDNRA
jgi:hypothetical protein